MSVVVLNICRFFFFFFFFRNWLGVYVVSSLLSITRFSHSSCFTSVSAYIILQYPVWNVCRLLVLLFEIMIWINNGLPINISSMAWRSGRSSQSREVGLQIMAESCQWLHSCLTITPLSHERLVANAHELGTSQDSLETSQDSLGCVLARPCMSRQVTETEREIPFSSHRLVAAVDFILSRERKFSPRQATKMQLNCIGPSRLVPAS